MNTEAPLPRKAAPRWWRWGFLLGTPVVFSVGVFGDPETPVREPRIGIWTYGSPLDASSEGKRAYVDDDTLHLLGERGIYMVYGCNRTEAGPKMAGHLERCRACGIEVHLSVTPTATSIDFVNIWSFEALAKDIEEVLVFLSAEGLLGDPVTTLVYDMEPLVEARFPTYGFDRAVVRKLRDYGEVSRAFRRFNGRIRETYGLDVRICSDLLQVVDRRDGDDDLSALCGLMYDDTASWSYMAYRRDNCGRDYLVAHCQLLDEG
ncbi:MAG TPA: hypothetical protein ENN80_03195, partial [Candidatus Hydrogenedentes bacterium]|nr:hypothetical protein [Candidatus Hydrogenedentota bacterium]